MVPLKEEVTVPAPIDYVWPLLSDPAVVASCIPGAELTAQRSDGVYQGSVKFKFGPTVVVFRGETLLSYDHASRRCTIDAKGIDQRGASRALAQFVVTASGTDATRIAIDGGFNMSGPLEMFAKAGGVLLAKTLIADFAANIARIVERSRAPPSAADTQDATPVPSAIGPEVLWRASAGWLRDKFKKESGEDK